MKTANQLVHRTCKALLIAELGHNHQGDTDTCLKMIKAAFQAGAPAVKLQKIPNGDLFTPAAYNAPYLNENKNHGQEIYLNTPVTNSLQKTRMTKKLISKSIYQERLKIMLPFKIEH